MVGFLSGPHGNNWQRTGHAHIEAFHDNVPSKPAEPLSVIEFGCDDILLDLI